MKRFLLSVVFSISAAGLMAQAPAAPPASPAPSVPAKPGLTLTSSAFEDGAIIPNKYTQAAAPATPVSPALAWTHVPDGTVSFALVLDDPDTSLNHTTEEVLHWMMFNIPAMATSLPENVGDQAQLADGSIQALNRAKKVGYLGMGASAAGPYHHYTFQLYALDTKLSLGPDATRADVMKAMDGHILGKGVTVGRFHRP